MRSLTLCLILFAAQLSAETIRTDWTGFRNQVEAMKLENRSAKVRLSSGKKLKVKRIAATDAGLEVSSGIVSKDDVASIKVNKKAGKAALIGMAIGAGAGAGISVAATRNVDTYEGPALAIVPGVIGATTIGGAIAGYFVGRSRSRAPEFIIQR